MKTRFENEHRIIKPDTYKVGDMVWTEKHRVEKGSSNKLNKLWRGPMEIIEIVSLQDVRLKDKTMGIEINGTVAVSNITGHIFAAWKIRK